MAASLEYDASAFGGPTRVDEEDPDEIYMSYVYTWGKPSLTGHGERVRERLPRILTEFELKQVVDVQCASYFSLALTNYGAVFIWGQEVAGNGDNISWNWETEGCSYPSKPKRIPTLDGHFVTGIACSTPGGDGSLCAGINDKGKLIVWNAQGDESQSEPDASEAPILLVHGIPDPVESVAAGDSMVGCITVKGEVWVWSQDDGLLLVTDALTNRRAVQISMGSMFIAVVTTDNDLFTWGQQNHNSNGGYLGHGDKYVDPQTDHSPRLVEALAGRVRLANCGWIHMTAIDLDGQLYSWGDGHTNRLGLIPDNDHDYYGTPRHSPCKVEALEGIEVLCVSNARGNEACITTPKHGNQVYTWGGSRFGGQFTSPTPTSLNRFMPIYRGGMAHIKKISCGRFHSILTTQVRMTLVEICLRHIAYKRMYYEPDDIRQLPWELQRLLHHFMTDRRLEPYTNDFERETTTPGGGGYYTPAEDHGFPDVHGGGDDEEPSDDENNDNDVVYVAQIGQERIYFVHGPGGPRVLFTQRVGADDDDEGEGDNDGGDELFFDDAVPDLSEE